MNGILITWPQLALLALIVLAVYGAELLLFLKKTQHLRRHDWDLLSTEQESLRDELTALRRELLALREQMEQGPAPEVVGETESAYSQAIKLAKQGLDSAAVAAGCGISRGEAELIVALYRGTHRQ